MFRYWTEFVTEEHMLYYGEIAEKYGIISKNGNPHPTAVRIIIELFLSEHGNNLSEEVLMKYYYVTKYGFTQVFHQALYHSAMLWFFRGVDISSNTKFTLLDENNRKIVFYVLPEKCSQALNSRA